MVSEHVLFLSLKRIETTYISKTCGSKDYRFGHRVKKINNLEAASWLVLRWIRRLEDEFLTWKGCAEKNREIFQKFLYRKVRDIDVIYPLDAFQVSKALTPKVLSWWKWEEDGRNAIGKMYCLSCQIQTILIFGLARWKWESYLYLNKSIYVYQNILKDKVSIYSARSCTRMQHGWRVLSFLAREKMGWRKHSDTPVHPGKWTEDDFPFNLGDV